MITNKHTKVSILGYFGISSAKVIINPIIIFQTREESSHILWQNIVMENPAEMTTQIQCIEN